MKRRRFARRTCPSYRSFKSPYTRPTHPLSSHLFEGGSDDRNVRTAAARAPTDVVDVLPASVVETAILLPCRQDGDCRVWNHREGRFALCRGFSHRATDRKSVVVGKE